MSLIPPQTVQKLQAALHAKAKGSPDYRFYALYDKVYRKDVLLFAYDCCKANKGAAGVDGQTFADIETYGLDRWLGELTQELKSRTYQPAAVRRVHIPKPDGKTRPLGIPVLSAAKDQGSCRADGGGIGARSHLRGRSAARAIRLSSRPQRAGRREACPQAADQWAWTGGGCGPFAGSGQALSGYFDGIPHAELMQSVARRVSDGAMLHLIKMWLEAPVEETDDRGGKQRTTVNRDMGKGTPQGAPISPALSNLYMRRFVLGWKALGHETRLDAHIVNYADDFVICCRSGAEQALEVMTGMMSKLKLAVNEAKTHVCQLPQETFDFLGYTFGRCHSPKTGRSYIGTKPAKKRVARLCAAIGDLTDRRGTGKDTGQVVMQLNRMITGWANYFCLGPVSRAYRAVDEHARNRLRQWLRKKHKVPGRGTTQFPDKHLHQKLGLIHLAPLTARLPWAKA